MELELKTALGDNYVSNSQKARVITEKWVSDNMFCPRCGNIKIVQFENNRPVADFYCPQCKSQYELKSKNGSSLDIVCDGAYDTMIKRIAGLDNPDFLFMSYIGSQWKVNNFFFVPKHFFTPEIIEKRPPLSSTARRAGWTGCNIILKKIPSVGKIPIIKNGIILDKNDFLKRVCAADALNISDMNSRGWMFDVMCCVDSISGTSFSLHDMYQFEDRLAQKHPNNRNIKAKIRQQLQLLRDKGIIEFTHRGEYMKVL